MDWESLTDLQQNLRGHEAVLMVSAPPLFGVKLIEPPPGAPTSSSEKPSPSMSPTSAIALPHLA